MHGQQNLKKKKKLYMFRTVPLSITRSFSLYTQPWYMSDKFAVSKTVWHKPLLCVQWKTPDDGQRSCPKHVEFYSKNQFEKFVHLVGFIIRIYHDARSAERQIRNSVTELFNIAELDAICIENLHQYYISEERKIFCENKIYNYIRTLKKNRVLQWMKYKCHGEGCFLRHSPPFGL